MDAETINAITKLAEFLVTHLGVYGLLGVPIGLFLAWLFVGWLRSRTESALVAEKEKTIQRLANDNRELRVVVYKEVHKWSDEEVEKFIIRNEHPDGASTRRELEAQKQPQLASSAATPKGHSASKRKDRR